MKNVKYIIFLIVCMALAFMTTSCTYSEADSRPEPTQQGLEAQKCVRANVATLSYWVGIAVHFNEYLAQTSDEGRRTIQDKYFYTWRILNENGIWKLIGNTQIEIAVENGILLGAPDARWGMQLRSIGSGEQNVLSIGTFSTEGTQISCELRYTEAVSASWLVDAEQEANDLVLTISGSGEHITYLNTVSYDITTPLVWEVAKQTPREGRFDAIMQTEFKKVIRVEPMDVEYLSGNNIRISCNGATQVWRYSDDNYRVVQ